MVPIMSGLNLHLFPNFFQIHFILLSFLKVELITFRTIVQDFQAKQTMEYLLSIVLFQKISVKEKIKIDDKITNFVQNNYFKIAANSMKGDSYGWNSKCYTATLSSGAIADSSAVPVCYNSVCMDSNNLMTNVDSVWYNCPWNQEISKQFFFQKISYFKKTLLIHLNI